MVLLVRFLTPDEPQVSSAARSHHLGTEARPQDFE
jgi:hypothetical protein